MDSKHALNFLINLQLSPTIIDNPDVKIQIKEKKYFLLEPIGSLDFTLFLDLSIILFDFFKSETHLSS